MTPELLTQITDIMGAGLNALKGDPAVGTGSGHGELPMPENAGDGPCDHGVSLAARRIQDVILKTHDYQAIKELLFDSPGHITKGRNLGAIAGAQFYHFCIMVGQQCRIDGTRVQSIAEYASYYNTGIGGPYNCTLSPLFAELFVLLWPSYPIPAECILTPDSGNIASRTAGQPPSLPPGVDPGASSGFGSVSAAFTDAVWSSEGNTSLVVRGMARLASGATSEDEAFTATCSLEPSSSTLLTPSTPGARMLRVDGVFLPSRMTGGSVVISGAAGRYYPQYPE